MKFKDYYETLGVERSAGADDIKAAYRRLARKYHPDVSRESDAESRFKEVGEAYEVLKDTDKRAAYDRLGENWRSGQDFTPPPGWEGQFDFGGRRSAGGFGGAGVDFSDFFESLFGGARARGGAGRPRQRRGRDERLRVHVNLLDAHRGTECSVQIRPQGAGESPRTLRVKVPPGVVDGQQIRLGGQGGPGPAGGSAGDLYLEVALTAHPFFRAESKDIHLALPITPWEAALGATMKVPTLAGPVDLKVPPGTQSGRVLRLRGRGLGGAQAGDQYVTIQIVAPPADSDEAAALYREMAEKFAFAPRAHLGV